MPTPYRGRQFTLHQPDGQQLQVRGWGNQYQAVFETLDGFTVVKNAESAFYEIATVSKEFDELLPTSHVAGTLDPSTLALQRGLRTSHAAALTRAREHSGLVRGGSRWEQRRREARSSLERAVLMGLGSAPPKRQTVGKFVGLCLLVDFPDVPGTIAADEVERFCNKGGYSGFGNAGSVRDYFLENSGKRLDYTNVVAPYYTAKHPRSYYTSSKVKQPVRTRELIKEALDHLVTTGFDFSKLTVDADGYVYALNVYYAGPCVNNWSEGLWPHAYHLTTEYQVSEGRYLRDYQITDMGDELTLGTFCHENGHMVCDFPDLYDYGDESAGVGAFCLMCGGGNVDSKNPTHVGAYLKLGAGWANVVERLVDGMTAVAPASKNHFFIHRRSKTEYFLIENRQKAGRDLALPGAGLAIWHVDELGDNSNEQMTLAEHYECSLKQADGRRDLERDRENQGDGGDLFAGQHTFAFNTNPSSKWWDGTPSGLRIFDIKAAAEDVGFSVQLAV